MTVTSTSPTGNILIADGFLSNLLERRAYRLVKLERAQQALESIEPNSAWMVDARVPVDAVAALASLTDLGFRVIDTNVQLDRPAADFAYAGAAPWLSVRRARMQDRPIVERVAADNLVTSRFHLDPRIGSALGRQIKAAWVGNFFERRRGDELFVVERDGAVEGFLLVLDRGDIGIIDLIALNPSARGQGAAGALIGAWIGAAPKMRRLLVGTQIANRESLRAYGKLGFRVCDATYVLHCHGLGA